MTDFFFSENKLTLHKCYCFQISRWEVDCRKLAAFRIWNYKRTDHAGFGFSLELFGFCVFFEFYDSRHWDFKRNRWMRYKK